MTGAQFIKEDGLPDLERANYAKLSAEEQRERDLLAEEHRREGEMHDTNYRRTFLGTEKYVFKILDLLGALKKQASKHQDPLRNKGPSFTRWFSYFGYYNDFGYRIPFYNLLHPFITWYNEHILWSQVLAFLNNVLVVQALVLALVCTFYSAVSYPDILAANLRFANGWEGGVDGQPGVLRTPWDANRCGPSVADFYGTNTSQRADGKNYHLPQNWDPSEDAEMNYTDTDGGVGGCTCFAPPP